jgi:hypothetical protein
MLEENVDSADIFVAITNAEEANILSSMLAKRLGCKKVMALINRPSYAELVETGNIDVAISPQQVTIGSLLAHVRKGDVVKVHSLRRGRAEAIEAIAHGKPGKSKVVGREIENIKLPQGPRARQGCYAGASRYGGRRKRPRYSIHDRSASHRRSRKTVSGRYLTLTHAPSRRSTHPWIAADGLQHHNAATGRCIHIF